MRAVISVRLRLSENARAVVQEHFAQVLHFVGWLLLGTFGVGSGGKERTEFAALRVGTSH